MVVGARSVVGVRAGDVGVVVGTVAVRSGGACGDVGGVPVEIGVVMSSRVTSVTLWASSSRMTGTEVNRGDGEEVVLLPGGAVEVTVPRISLVLAVLLLAMPLVAASPMSCFSASVRAIMRCSSSSWTLVTMPAKSDSWTVMLFIRVDIEARREPRKEDRVVMRGGRIFGSWALVSVIVLFVVVGVIVVIVEGEVLRRSRCNTAAGGGAGRGVILIAFVVVVVIVLHITFIVW